MASLENRAKAAVIAETCDELPVRLQAPLGKEVGPV